jgi:Cof subfamily protein (haloacid dehalogenase superfamily)
VRYKMIALDIDGTLNNDEKQITPRTREALIRVQQQGVVVVLASGRPASGLARESIALELARHNGLLLSCNGALVKDAETNAVLHQSMIPRATAKALLRHIERYPVTGIVEDGTTLYATDPNGYCIEYECRNNNLRLEIVDNVADRVDFCPAKILIAAPRETLTPLIGAIEAPFAEDLSFVQSAPVYLEATLRGTSKAESLRLVCAHLGIASDEVMAFGDGHNDMSMLEFAGHGVAMGNACEELKRIANEVTLTNNEDGIAHALARHFG